MHKKRPQPVEVDQRPVALDPRDLEDFRRLLAKLGRAKSQVPAPSREPRAANDGESLITRARDLHAMRRKRVAIFGPQMFAEPA